MKTFIEGSAFRRRSGRLLARKLVSEVDLRALSSDPVGMGDALIVDVWKIVEEKFLAESIAEAIKASETLGLSLIDHDTIVKAVMDEVSGVMAETMPFMQEAIAEAIRDIEHLSAVESAAALLSDPAVVDEVLAPVENVLAQLGGGLVSVTEETTMYVAREATALENPETLFVWQTAEDDSVCEDVFENSCAPRAGEELLLDEWDIFGQPQGESLICTMYAKGGGSNCRCWLDASGDAGDSPVQISDAVAAGNAAADALYMDEA